MALGTIVQSGVSPSPDNQVFGHRLDRRNPEASGSPGALTKAVLSIFVARARTGSPALGVLPPPLAPLTCGRTSWALAAVQNGQDKRPD